MINTLVLIFSVQLVNSLSLGTFVSQHSFRDSGDLHIVYNFV